MRKRTIILMTLIALFLGLTLSAPVSSENVRITSSGETLYYLSTATPTINVSPNALNFGNVNVGSSSTLSVTVSNTGVGDLIIGAVSSPSAPFSKTTDTCSNQTRAQGTNCTVSIQFAPTAAGSFNGSFTIPSNDPANSNFTVTLSGTGVAGPQITATPNPVDFGTVNIGSNSTITVTVRNTGSQNLVFSSITSPASPFSRTGSGPGVCANNTTLAPSGTCTMQVRFSPTAEATSNGSFVINSNAGNAPAYAISLTGIGRPIPQISISPNPVDFGSVANNSNNTRTVTVSSTGSKTLIVSSYTSPSAPFSITGSTCTAGINLAVGSNCTITVRYAPTATGTHSGSFIVYSDTGDMPGTPTTVNLTGNSGALLPACSASFSPSSISAGGSSTLSWSTTNAVSGTYSCTGNIGSGSLPSLNGSVMTYPNAQTCTLTVQNSTGQTGTCSASVAINTTLPACSASFSPSSISAGQASTLSWSTTNAVSGSYSCTGNIGSGSLPSLNGSVVTYPNAQTCTLTVQNSTGQTGTCSASVAVNPANPPPNPNAPMTICITSQVPDPISAPGRLVAFQVSGSYVRLVTVNTHINPTASNIVQSGSWITISSSSGTSCVTGGCLVKSGSTLYLRTEPWMSNWGGTITPGWGGYTYVTACDGQSPLCSRMGLEATSNQMRALCQSSQNPATHPFATTSTGQMIPYTP